MQSLLKTRTRCALLVISLACLPVADIPLSAQAIYGNIYGPVTDPTGAAIPNATITVTDESKGTSVQATSNQSGEYTVSNLIPDVYDIKADGCRVPGGGEPWNPGLRRYFAEGRPEAQCRHCHAKALTVTTEAPQLQTDRADVGTVFNQKNDLRPAHRRGVTLPAFNC